MEDGSAGARKAYQRVKERLVGLSVELDDKEHTSSLLTQMIKKERIKSQKSMDEKATEHKNNFERKCEVDKATLLEVFHILQDIY
jgi:hypothetical protein